MKRWFCCFGMLFLVNLPLYTQPVTLDPLPAGTVKFTSGTDEGFTGFSVTPVGDFNGDSIPDFAISEPSKDRVYIVNLRSNVDTVNLSQIITNILDPNGFYVTGNPQTDFGFTVSGIGDFNGDGFDDVAIGAPFDGDGGRIYVLKGRTAPTPTTVDNESRFALILDGNPGDVIGQVIGGKVNLNNDRFQDLVFTNPFSFNDQGDTYRIGSAHIFYGTTSTTTRKAALSNLILQEALTLYGPTLEQSNILSFAEQFQPVGDVTGDGVEDAAFFAGTDSVDESGSVVILPGGVQRNGAYAFDEVPFATRTVKFRVFSRADSHVTSAITGGDVDNDGINDLICGFSAGDIDGKTNQRGVAAVVSGAAISSGGTIVDSTSHPDAAFFGHWLEASGFGKAMTWSPYGLAIAAPNAVTPFSAGKRAGAVYLLRPEQIQFGAATTQIQHSAAAIYYGVSEFSLFGNSLAWSQNADGNVIEELFISSPGGNDATGIAAALFPVVEMQGDLNGDGVRDPVDVYLLSASWNQTGSPGDLNGDGSINVNDLIRFRLNLSTR